MNNVDDFIFTSNAIPTKLCRELIKECENAKWEKHRWSVYGKNETEYSYPQKELDMVYSTTQQFHTLGPLIMKAVVAYQEKVSWPDKHTKAQWIEHITQVRFNKYTEGTKMRTHYDHIRSMFDGKMKGIPILAIVGLLNDNYEGGEFMMRGKEVKLVRGDILIFPSNFMYPHEVKEITEGVRHSFVSWAF
jgi:predicted 2-oxoglutarate/Fe(II)-dependent dioxygenase YbiX|tara:strand:+ start:575 stop:1144 length:570 start_codon:yes stop_codon:yes gene_type:complete